MGTPEGDLAWCGWVKDALPLEGGWIHSAVVDLGKDFCYLQWWLIKKMTEVPSSGALAVEHSIPLPKQHSLVYKGVWELSGYQGVSLFPVIDF
jgi:hypothetical protein